MCLKGLKGYLLIFQCLSHLVHSYPTCFSTPHTPTLIQTPVPRYFFTPPFYNSGKAKQQKAGLQHCQKDTHVSFVVCKSPEQKLLAIHYLWAEHSEPLRVKELHLGRL